MKLQTAHDIIIKPLVTEKVMKGAEQARTYGAPQFVEQFGSFQTLSRRYGGAQNLKADLEAVKQHLYVSMTG